MRVKTWKPKLERKEDLGFTDRLQCSDDSNQTEVLKEFEFETHGEDCCFCFKVDKRSMNFPLDYLWYHDDKVARNPIKNLCKKFAEILKNYNFDK